MKLAEFIPWASAYYLALSLVTFLGFGVDKLSARIGGRRLSERRLLQMSFFGGFIGAYAASALFRHKTQKRSFRSRLVWGPAFHFLIWSAALAAHAF